MPTRRSMLQTVAGAMLGLSLQRLVEGAALDGSSIDELNPWIQAVFKNSNDLSKSRSTPLQWQETMDRVFRDTPLEPLRTHLGFPQLAGKILDKMPAGRRELFHPISLIRPADVEKELKPEPHQALITKVAYVRKGFSIPPHGHSNMVSAFLCLSGEFDVRLYDRLDDRPDSLVVRQTVEAPSSGPGTWSSISDYRDNVHWLTAKSDDCFLLTTKLVNIEPDIPLNGRINIDIRSAQQLGSGTFLASKITSQQAAELY